MKRWGLTLCQTNLKIYLKIITRNEEKGIIDIFGW